MQTYWQDAMRSVSSRRRTARVYRAYGKKVIQTILFFVKVLTRTEEFVAAPGFSTDPLEEQHSVVPGTTA